MKKVLLTAVCFSVMALGALNVQAADDMPLPPPPPHHGDEMLPPPPPPGADKAMEKKMEKMEKRCLKTGGRFGTDKRAAGAGRENPQRRP